MAAPMLRCWVFGQSQSLQRLLVFVIARRVRYEKSCACFSTSHRLLQRDALSGEARKTEISSSGDAQSTPSLSTSGQDRLGHLMQMYEDFVGLTDVKQAQEKVVNAEQKFLQVQEDRRAMQQELLTVQAEVRAVGAELEKTSRTDTRYIDLVKKEHEILLIEKEMTSKIKTLDKAERDFFALLSAALRESHEKERARAEKTKYWSIIGSVIGAIIGIAGSTFNNFKRMKELRAIVTESGDNTAEYKALATKMLETVVTQHSKLEEFVQNIGNMETTESLEKSKLTDPLFVSYGDFSKHTEAILQNINKQSDMLLSQLQEIQQLVSVQKSSESDGHVVYVGPQLEEILHQTEEKLRGDLKRNSLVTTMAIGGVVTIGLSIVVFLFSGSS